MPLDHLTINLRKVPWTAVFSAVALAGAGYTAWDDMGDGLTAQAQSLDTFSENTAGQFVGVWEELEDLSEGVDLTEEQIEQIQRQMIEMTGQQRATVAEIRGDVKLILRLLEERNE